MEFRRIANEFHSEVEAVESAACRKELSECSSKAKNLLSSAENLAEETTGAQREALLAECREMRETFKTKYIAALKIAKRANNELLCRKINKGEETELTDSLRQIASMMKDEVERSVEIRKSFSTSSNLLSKALENHGAFKRVIQNSSKFVSKHFRADQLEKILLRLSYAVFFITVAYIVKRNLPGGLFFALKRLAVILFRSAVLFFRKTSSAVSKATRSMIHGNQTFNVTGNFNTTNDDVGPDFNTTNDDVDLNFNTEDLERIY